MSSSLLMGWENHCIVLAARSSKAFGSLLGHGWKGATETNARKNKSLVAATFFMGLEGSKCGSLALGSPLGTPRWSGCRDEPPLMLGSQHWISSFSSEMPNRVLPGDSDIWDRGVQ